MIDGLIDGPFDGIVDIGADRHGRLKGLFTIGVNLIRDVLGLGVLILDGWGVEDFRRRHISWRKLIFC